MAELTDAHIKEILEAAVSAGLAVPARRALLFAGVDAFYWQSIDGQDSPLDQLRADLNALRESASDGEPEYFARWLSNAAQMARPKRQARVLEAMGAHLGGGAPESSAGEAVGHSRGPATMAGSDGTAPQVGGETPFFSWVHLSDIHFSHGDAHEQWDQALVLDKIIKDFKQFTAEGIPSPDVVLVTGDLAYSGGADKNLAEGESEYGLTRAWLEKVAAGLGLERTDIFMVPGNHDVNWGADKDRNTWRMVQSIREGQETLDEALKDPGDRARLFERHAQYLDFVSAFAAPCATPFWHHELKDRGLTVRLIGLDTALVAKSGDEGKLFLGLEQWRTATEGLADGTLAIVLTHHPLRQGWLGDETDMKRWIRGDGHIHLCGHIHEGESAEGWAGGGRGHVEIIAGAAHAPEAERIFGHGYNVSAVYPGDDGQLALHVWPRKWSEKNKDFRADADNTLRGKAYARHRLDLKNP